MELQRVRPDHEAAILDFERTNRNYFARSISDRGDEFFSEFAERHRLLLADQDAGRCAFHVLVDEDGEIVGRFNLYDLADRRAEVGYRVAQRVGGLGVATSGLQNLCRLAAEEYGLRTLTAAVGDENMASRRVLVKAGFVAAGSTEVAGRRGTRFELDLTGT